jgi:hypothetical protein
MDPRNEPKPEANPEETSEAETAPGKSEGQKLTPEEQMALYEESLKESDWGHQPC